jgi:antitoxin (DNA-binding transcriptional repressor) of toxin-antitoxin stability system
MWLLERFGAGHAVILAGPGGQIADIVTVGQTAGVQDPPRDAPRFATGAVPVVASVLISTCRGPVCPIRPVDLIRFERWGQRLARAGAPLIDWIETDGDDVRSYAYITDPATAWLDDPDRERWCDHLVDHPGFSDGQLID